MREKEFDFLIIVGTPDGEYEFGEDEFDDKIEYSSDDKNNLLIRGSKGIHKIFNAGYWHYVEMRIDDEADDDENDEEEEEQDPVGPRLKPSLPSLARANDDGVDYEQGGRNSH